MGSFSIWHWLIVLGIVVLVFGTRKLKDAGGDLGSAVRNFKQAVRDGEAEAQLRLAEPVTEKNEVPTATPEFIKGV